MFIYLFIYLFFVSGTVVVVVACWLFHFSWNMCQGGYKI